MKKIIVSFVLVLSLLVPVFILPVSAVSPLDPTGILDKISDLIVPDTKINLPEGYDYYIIGGMYGAGTKNDSFNVYFTKVKLQYVPYFEGGVFSKYVVDRPAGISYIYCRFDKNTLGSFTLAHTSAVLSSAYSHYFEADNGDYYHDMRIIQYMNYVPEISDDTYITEGEFYNITNGHVPSILDDTTEVDDIDEDSKDKFLDFIPFDITGPDFSDCQNPIDYVVTFVKWAAASSIRFGFILFANLKILMDNITKFPAILINYTNDMIKLLFIPSEGFLESRYVLINKVLNNKFVFIKQISDYLTSFYIQFQHLTSTAPVIAFTYNGASHTFIDFSFLDDYIEYIRIGTSIVLWIPFLIKMYKRIPTLINSIPQDN